MKVLVAESPGVAKYVDLPKPEATEDSVVVKVKACGICATDLSILRGDAGFLKDGSTKYPVRFGHEWSGIVESVGPNVKNFKPGDLVISDNGVSCGVCPSCASGEFRKCKNNRAVGTIRTWPGAFSEYVSFPERHVHHLAEGVTIENGAMVEPASIAASGIMKLNTENFDTLLIIGTGAIGQCAVAFAKYAGISKVILAGRTDAKLDVGKKMGADVVINTQRENLKDYVKEHCGGTVGNILDCSGNIEVLNACIDLLAREGTLALAGFFERKYTDFDIDAFIMKHGHMHGVMGGYQYTQVALEGVNAGVDLSPAITKRIPFEDAGRVITEMATALKNKEIKVLVEFD